jgi:peptidoglycan/LPS O-acetylase OafA/YrhL
MDLRRLRAGEWIAAASGVALLVSLFLPWYGAPDLTAWEALSAIDVLLAFVAAAGVLLALVTATQRVPAVSIALSALVTLAGLVGVVLVLVRALDLPDGAGGREWALWLGLAGAAGIVVGAVLAMRDERLSEPGGHTDATGRPVPPPAEIERLPAPDSR